MHHPQRQNVTTSMVDQKRVAFAKISPKMLTLNIWLGMQKRKEKKLETKSFSRLGKTTQATITRKTTTSQDLFSPGPYSTMVKDLSYCQFACLLCRFPWHLIPPLHGLIIIPPCWPSGEASASRAEDHGSIPACAGICSGLSHTSDLIIGTPVATLPGAWHYRVSTGTGQPSVSIL